MDNVTRTRPRARRRRLPELPGHRARRRRDDARCGWSTPIAILANQGRAQKPTLIDYMQDRNGKVIYRADTRALRRLQHARTGTASRCRARRCARKQMIDPRTAYQMVHIMEGVVQRGTAARAARPQPAAGRQDRHDQRARPTSGSSAARPTWSPASIWASTIRGRWAATRRAARSPRRSSSNSRKAACKDWPVDAVPRAGRHPHGADRPPLRPEGVRRLADRRSQGGGDLGSVQAGERTAPQLAPRGAARARPPAAGHEADSARQRPRRQRMLRLRAGLPTPPAPAVPPPTDGIRTSRPQFI